jgi:hypothetical protein
VDPDSDANRDVHRHFRCDRDSHSDEYTLSIRVRVTDANGERDSFEHTHGLGDRHGDSDADEDADTDEDPDEHSDNHADTDRNADEHSDEDADAREAHDRDADSDRHAHAGPGTGHVRR